MHLGNSWIHTFKVLNGHCQGEIYQNSPGSFCRSVHILNVCGNHRIGPLVDSVHRGPADSFFFFFFFFFSRSDVYVKNTIFIQPGRDVVDIEVMCLNQHFTPMNLSSIFLISEHLLWYKCRAKPHIQT